VKIVGAFVGTGGRSWTTTVEVHLRDRYLGACTGKREFRALRRERIA
jgi:hypothetical protein